MNVTSINKQALAQTYYILNGFNEINKNKIPNTLINTISENMDKEYKNTSELLEETREILYAILNKYVLNQSQKEKLAEYYRFYDAKMEEEKIKKYQYNYFFKKDEEEIEKSEIKEDIENVSLIPYKESAFSRLFNKIKNLFKRI